MKRTRTQVIKDTFLRLSEADPAERERILATEHDDDPELRGAVKALLERSAQLPDGFLEPMHEVAEAAGRARANSGVITPGGSPHGVSFGGSTDTGKSGQRVGRYQLRRKIGEGGFGVVWEAEQCEPMRRSVALKLIKRGMDTQQVIARFAAEQQALALMDHPSIARVLDAGSTDAGLPYFVMELVEGTPIVQYCAERELSTSARLQLFEDTCRAMHHAHQRGIVHRDIKPSNVLVTERDGVAKPKVIDFGIAKAVGAGARPSSRLTQQRQLVGTPAYMAPEQTESGGGEIDARSDVYALGVLLYELLCGSTPFDGGGESTSTGFETIARRIREQPAIKPSRRSQRPGTLPAELDWVTLKCLEKEKERRYESALALADDVRRCLEHQPVLAGPPDLLYRLRKFYWRHRLAVASVAAVAAMFFVVVTIGFFWAAWKNRQLDAANTNLQVKNDQYLRGKAIAERALQDVERLSDAHLLDRLVVRAERDLWPALPEKQRAMEQWLVEAQALLHRAEAHRSALRAVRARALPAGEAGFESDVRAPDRGSDAAPARPRVDPSTGDDDQGIDPRASGSDSASSVAGGATTRFFATAKDAWLHGLLTGLVRRLDDFAAPDSGTVASVRRRLAFASELQVCSIDDHAAAWQRVLEGIERGGTYPVLSRTGLTPQVGLVPLGPDPDSGLYEFLDLATHTGPVPGRDADGRLLLGQGTGVVLVLLPGGTYSMGSQEDDEQAPNFDTLSVWNERPVHEVTVEPFFLGKHELTQAQWMHLEDGSNPSYFFFGVQVNGHPITRRHPVEQVEWGDGRRVLRKAGLQLPTEEQWEYAARAGSATTWFFGTEALKLHRYANFADVSSEKVVMRVSNLDDGQPFTAPVGSFEPNGFGLHDVYGNVAEWCVDLFRPNYHHEQPLAQPLSFDAVRDPRRHAVRGGAWGSLPNKTRSAHRDFARGTTISSVIGLRPARQIRRR